MKRYDRLNSAFAAALVVASVVVCISTSYSEDSWLSEFSDICARTQDADASKKDELQTLISRCDKVRTLIEQSDNPQKNVYLFRLEKCRKLFIYILDTSEK